MMGNYWLSKMSTMSSDDQKSSYQLNVYITIVCVGILASLVRSSFTYKVRTLSEVGFTRLMIRIMCIVLIADEQCRKANAR